MNAWIRQIIPSPVYEGARRAYHGLKGALKYGKLYRIRLAGRCFYVIGAADHSNMGDQAIAQAQNELLSGHPFIEITYNQLPDHMALLRGHLQKDDVLLITGGGNMGIEWFGYEQHNRNIIEEFPKNKVVIFPQTIYYGNSENGERELANSIAIYSRHHDLHLCARESTSYAKMKECYPQNNVYLIPDMVLSLNYSQPHFERAGILLCFRRDPERTLTDAMETHIETVCTRFDKDIRRTDMMANGDAKIAPAERQSALEAKSKEFKQSRLVITDRLHGMVFAAITGTPCIALSNYNHKVSGVYEWIKNLDYIVYLTDVQEVAPAVERLLALGRRVYDDAVLAPRYDQLRDLLQIQTK